MKHLLSIIGVLFSLHGFSQISNNNFIFQNQQTLINYSYPQVNSYNAVANNASAEVVLWSEDFANGLNGNNSSTDQSWTVEGPNGNIWQHDTDGSNGTYAGTNPYTLNSETKENGWMIFDADLSNPGPQSGYQNRKGQLISPYIDLSNDSNVTLTFEHAYRWCCNSNHKLKVYIGTNQGWSATSFTLNENENANVLYGTTKKQIIISDIAALKDSVRIRFDWADGQETASHYFWMIDDVKLIKTEAYATSFLNAYIRTQSNYFGGTSYRIMPLSQAQGTEYFFGGVLENVGYNTIDSTRVMAFINNPANYNGQSYGTNLSSTDIDTNFTNSGFTPTVVGDYAANIYFKNDASDIHTDTLVRNFSISEFEYGRDYAESSTSLGIFSINDDGPHQFGNVFDIYEDANLYAVRIRLDNRTGDNAKGKIMINTVNNQGGIDFLYETSGFINLGQHAGSWVNISLEVPLQLTKGQIIVATLYSDEATSNNDTLWINTSGINEINGESLIQDINGVQQGVQAGDWLYTTSPPCLRLNFNPNAQGISVEEQEDFVDTYVYPNPNKGQFYLSIHTQQQEDLTLNVINILGQSVHQEFLNNVNSLNKVMNLKHLEKGIYFISLKNTNNHISTQKIIIN